MTTDSIPTQEEYTYSSSSSSEDNTIVRQQAVFIMDKIIMTFVTSEAQHVRDWVHEVEYDNCANRLRLIVGFDVKLSSLPHRPIALLLLFIRRTCLLFDIRCSDKIPTALFRFLSDRKNNTFVGVGIEAKLAQLHHEFGLGGGARWVDLASVTAARYGRPELREAGVSRLRKFLHGGDVARLWGDDYDKWDEEEDLSYEHVRHACIDVYTCYELGSYLVYPMKRSAKD